MMNTKLVQDEPGQHFWHITPQSNVTDIELNGLKRGERGYVWCATSREAALEFAEMVGFEYALVHFLWPFEETQGDEDMDAAGGMQEVYRMIAADVPPHAVVGIEYGA